MFGTLYEPPSLTLSGFVLLVAVQLCAIFVYKQAASYYRQNQAYGAQNLAKSFPPPAVPIGPAGSGITRP